MFYFTLPIITSQSSLLSYGDLLAISAAILLILYISAPDPEPFTDFPKHKTFRDYLFAAWCGYLPLWKIFWPFFILLNGTLIYIDYLAKTGTLTVSSWDVAHFVLINPIIWWVVSIWRASFNTRSKFWAASARLATLAIVLEYMLKLFIRMQYPRIFFNCQELMLDYGNCF